MHLIESSREDCEKQVAKTIAHKLNELASQKSQVVFGICGGRSVENIFKHLLEVQVDWKKVHIFMVDERCTSLNSTDSNYRLAYNAFLKTLVETKKLDENNLHPFIYDPAAIVASLRRYNTELKAFGGFDLILLSSGEDGHVAALFPKHRSITNETKEYFILKDSPKPPKERVTSSRKLLQTAKVAIVLFFGKEKDQAFQKFQDSTTRVEDCPVKLALQIPEIHVSHTIN